MVEFANNIGHDMAEIHQRNQENDGVSIIDL